MRSGGVAAGVAAAAAASAAAIGVAADAATGLLPGPAVAAPLRAGLAELAARMPRGVASAADIPAYRAASLARAESREAFLARTGLVATDLEIAGHGSAVTVLRAVGAAGSPALRVVYLHGGGLIAGTRFAGADLAGRFAASLGLEVWTVDYPLAPEAIFDEMIEMVLGVLREAVADGVSVVLAGQSAGGGLAAAVGLACRDAGIELAGLLLACPMLDARETVSARQFADDSSWGARSNRIAWAAALGARTDAAATPGSATDVAETTSRAIPPGERTDLAGLPPVFLDVGSAEVFRDSTTGFATRLWAAGVSAELHVWDGAYHSSDFVTEPAEVSRAAHAARGSWLARIASL